jgi:hypothetical protein
MNRSFNLPTRFGHARNLSITGVFAKAQAAHFELPHKSTRAPAQGATVFGPRGKFGFHLGFSHQ